MLNVHLQVVDTKEEDYNNIQASTCLFCFAEENFFTSNYYWLDKQAT